jgi:5,10-methylenetetrahydrofolate reductase
VHAGRLSAQPNAGQPRDVDGRHLYLSSPEYMASYARRFVAAGVRLVGGCCGTTPEHTRQIALAVRQSSPAARTGVPRPAPPTSVARGLQTPAARSVQAGDRPAPQAPVDRPDKSDLGRALARQTFPVIVELATPRGLNLDGAIQQARRFSDLGAVAVSVPDYPRAGARATALALAALLERHGIETLWHSTCRGRTLAAVQADLLSAHVMGIRNVLATTGVPMPVMGQGPTDPAGEVDAIGLVALASRLNQGLDLAAEPLGEATRFHIAVAFNPFAADQDAEWRRLDRKIEAGAELVVLPPVLDPEAVEPALDRLRTFDLPILAWRARGPAPARRPALSTISVVPPMKRPRPGRPRPLLRPGCDPASTASSSPGSTDHRQQPNAGWPRPFCHSRWPHEGPQDATDEQRLKRYGPSRAHVSLQPVSAESPHGRRAHGQLPRLGRGHG